MAKEVRGGIPAEVREMTETAIRVGGYAAVFDEEADIGGMFRERILPGAFTAALQRKDDVVFLINHDGLPLATTRAGTLTLREDDRGLYMESELARRDPDVERIVHKMARGDLDKMSFAFRATRQDWDDTQEPPLRTIREVELFDVAIVTTPAYAGTDIGLRSLRDFRADVAQHNFAGARRRLRMKANLAARAG